LFFRRITAHPTLFVKAAFTFQLKSLSRPNGGKALREGSQQTPHKKQMEVS